VFELKAVAAGGRFVKSYDDFMRTAVFSSGTARNSGLADQQTFLAWPVVSTVKWQLWFYRNWCRVCGLRSGQQVGFYFKKTSETLVTCVKCWFQTLDTSWCQERCLIKPTISTGRYQNWFLLYLFIYLWLFNNTDSNPKYKSCKWPTWRTITLFYNTFITVLYMFRATSCSSSGGQIVLIQHLV